MTRNDAVRVCVCRVDQTGLTFVVVRRGYKYDAQTSTYPIKRGWKVAEQIGPGNVQNFREV